MSPSRALLFYSAWGLGYHNVEAERKAVALAEDGWDVVYVAGVGIRNPRLRTAGKAVDRLRAALRDRGSATPEPDQRLRTTGLLVVPPRQLAPLRRLNGRLIERSLLAAVPDWSRSLAWVRWPTPELVDVLERAPPAAVVYECVDSHHLSPGVTGRWRPIHDDAERRLVALSPITVVPGEALAEHLHGQGAADVRIVPHGVDLFGRTPPRPREERLAHPVLGFVGTLDYRVDQYLVQHLAIARPHWAIRMIGPLQEGFDPSVFAGLPNVTVEPPVAHERLGELLAEFDAGLMPYRADRNFRHMVPVKNLELLAAGRPAVARASPALLRYQGLVSFANTPDEFLAEIDAALKSDTPELATRRREAAEQESWGRRLAEITAIAGEAVSGR